jgi:hypothetical protein
MQSSENAHNHFLVSATSCLTWGQSCPVQKQLPPQALKRPKAQLLPVITFRKPTQRRGQPNPLDVAADESSSQYAPEILPSPGVSMSMELTSDGGYCYPGVWWAVEFLWGRIVQFPFYIKRALDIAEFGMGPDLDRLHFWPYLNVRGPIFGAKLLGISCGHGV